MKIHEAKWSSELSPFDEFSFQTRFFTLRKRDNLKLHEISGFIVLCDGRVNFYGVYVDICK